MGPEISDDEALNLTGQEARCIELACGYLSRRYGGVWRVIQSLEAQHPSEPTPEVLAGNSDMTAAIEVTRLVDPCLQAFEESILSNKGHLAPTCGGYYILIAPPGLLLPMEQKLRRHIKGEIERVAPTLAVGESGAVRVPRQGWLELRSRSGALHIWCLHAIFPNDLLGPLGEGITGQFLLYDPGLHVQPFVTDEGEAEFRRALAAACRECLPGGPVEVTWHEEWKLTKLGNDEDGVWVLAATEAPEMEGPVAECVKTVVEHVRKKFAGRRWADLHVGVFESSIHTPEPWVSAAIASLEPQMLEGIDLLLLVDGESCGALYASPDAQTR